MKGQLIEKIERSSSPLVAAYILLFSACAAADLELADRNYDLRRFNVQVYSKAFAQRFELPGANVIDELPKELHALELVAERHPSADIIYCNLKLYFDSSLPVYLPEGPPAGSLKMRTQGSHFFNTPKRDERGRSIGWSEADRIASSLGESPYNRAAALATRDYKFPVGNIFVGAFSDIRIHEYHRELFPGVGYMEFGPGCALLAGTGRYAAGWNLWVKRHSGADYTRTLREKPEDFYIWPVPEALFVRFRAVASRVAQFNAAWRERPRAPEPSLSK